MSTDFSTRHGFVNRQYVRRRHVRWFSDCGRTLYIDCVLKIDKALAIVPQSNRFACSNMHEASITFESKTIKAPFGHRTATIRMTVIDSQHEHRRLYTSTGDDEQQRQEQQEQ